MCENAQTDVPLAVKLWARIWTNCRLLAPSNVAMLECDSRKWHSHDLAKSAELSGRSCDDRRYRRKTVTLM